MDKRAGERQRQGRDGAGPVDPPALPAEPWPGADPDALARIDGGLSLLLADIRRLGGPHGGPLGGAAVGRTHPSKANLGRPARPEPGPQRLADVIPLPRTDPLPDPLGATELAEVVDLGRYRTARQLAARRQRRQPG